LNRRNISRIEKEYFSFFWVAWFNLLVVLKMSKRFQKNVLKSKLSPPCNKKFPSHKRKLKGFATKIQFYFSFVKHQTNYSSCSKYRWPSLVTTESTEDWKIPSSSRPLNTEWPRRKTIASRRDIRHIERAGGRATSRSSSSNSVTQLLVMEETQLSRKKGHVTVRNWIKGNRIWKGQNK
jgi:hypothetical protein